MTNKLINLLTLTGALILAGCGNSNPRITARGDLTGDGFNEIVFTEGQLIKYRVVGGRDYKGLRFSKTLGETDGEIYNLVVQDVNQDGHNDVVTRGKAGITVYENHKISNEGFVEIRAQDYTAK